MFSMMELFELQKYVQILSGKSSLIFENHKFKFNICFNIC